MKIFLSWSGPRAEKIALVVESALKSIYPGVDFFHSSEGVGTGNDWRTILRKRLAKCDFGIAFLTPDRPNAPWPQFEAGAISKRSRRARVVPFLVGLDRRDVASPLQAYEPTVIGADPTANKAQILRLLESIAMASPSALEVSFSVFENDSWWNELEQQLRQAAMSFWHPSIYTINEAPLLTYQDSYTWAKRLFKRCRKVDLLSSGFFFHANVSKFRSLLEERVRRKKDQDFKARVIVQDPDSKGWRINVKHFYSRKGNEIAQKRLIESLSELAAESPRRLKFRTTTRPLARITMRFDRSALIVPYGYKSETLEAPVTWIPDGDHALDHFREEFKTIWRKAKKP